MSSPATDPLHSRGFRSGLAGAIAVLLAIVVCLLVLPRAHRGHAEVTVGVDLETGLYETAAIGEFSTLIGQHVKIAQDFVSWRYANGSTANRFPAGRVQDVLAEGVEPEITWDPTIVGAPVDQPQMSLADIADGRFDSYIRGFARAAKSVREPILLRFAHEMNGRWTSYYVGNSGNRRGDFIRAWRHVFDIFVSVGARNVQWVWSPNAVGSDDHSLSVLYPGNRYVDWVGLDGYSYPNEGCRPLPEIFEPGLSEIARFSDRPQMLAEVGVSAACADKATLIDGLFAWLAMDRRVKAIVWWQRDEDGVNWTIDSSSASLTAFRAGVASADPQR